MKSRHFRLSLIGVITVGVLVWILPLWVKRHKRENEARFYLHKLKLVLETEGSIGEHNPFIVEKGAIALLDRTNWDSKVMLPFTNQFGESGVVQTRTPFGILNIQLKNASGSNEPNVVCILTTENPRVQQKVVFRKSVVPNQLVQ